MREQQIENEYGMSYNNNPRAVPTSAFNRPALRRIWLVRAGSAYQPRATGLLGADYNRRPARLATNPLLAGGLRRNAATASGRNDETWLRPDRHCITPRSAIFDELRRQRVLYGTMWRDGRLRGLLANNSLGKSKTFAT
ncbi:MAG: hypothetical protein ACLUQ6_12980 [Alistipes onderdonkii]